jgi:hypothetical protein
MNVGGNAVAHVRKDGRNPTETETYPFGSIFWHNSACCTWFIKDAEATTEGTTKTIGLYNKKMNLSAKLPAVGFAIDFDPDRTSFSSADVRDVSELAASLPLWQRIKEEVRHGPHTIADCQRARAHERRELRADRAQAKERVHEGGRPRRYPTYCLGRTESVMRADKLSGQLGLIRLALTDQADRQ